MVENNENATKYPFYNMERKHLRPQWNMVGKPKTMHYSGNWENKSEGFSKPYLNIYRYFLTNSYYVHTYNTHSHGYHNYYRCSLIITNYNYYSFCLSNSSTNNNTSIQTAPSNHEASFMDLVKLFSHCISRCYEPLYGVCHGHDVGDK